MKEDHDERRRAIREVLRTHRVQTQEALRRTLRKQGIEVTQATLSRDLAFLNAHRVSGRDGTHYALGESAGSVSAQAQSATNDMVVSIQASIALVIVLTTQGAASIVAAAIDQAQLPEVLGTIAGDDTIFVAPAPTTTPQKLLVRLSKLCGLTQPRHHRNPRKSTPAARSATR
jgi:transcriptional regulator of arginine metabolism